MNPSASRAVRARNLILTAMLAGLLSSCAVAPSPAEEAPEETAAAAAAPAAVAEEDADSDADAPEPEVAHATELNVGDCIQEDTGEDEVGDVNLVPCDQPHSSEVYAAMDLEDGAYPGEEVVNAEAEEFCLAEFEPYVGISYSDSLYYFGWMSPTPATWNLADDREILCQLFDSSGELISGSLRGAQR